MPSATRARPETLAQPLNDTQLSSLFDELFPICRSITGPGYRASLEILRRHMPLRIEQVPSGTRVFDWVIPDEWHFKSAVLTGPNGEVVADARNHNLHVLGYSEAVDRELSLEELQPHLFSLPNLPNAIPYATSYYKSNWGFCITDETRRALPEGLYRARIEAEHVEGSVDFGHCTLTGQSSAEIVLSSYLCHPSLANNELSGPLVLLGLYDRISRWPRRRYSYRFVVNPETIGSLCFLRNHGEYLSEHMLAGMVLTCIGGPSEKLDYKLSRRGDSPIDRLIQRDWSDRIQVRPFNPANGSDERQYCSPGFNLPMGQMARTRYGQYDGYHNSLDTKASMGIDSLMSSIDQTEQLLLELESAGHFINTSPFGEPQLGKRGLYPNVNAEETRSNSADDILDSRLFLNRVLTVLNYCDGEHSILDIADKCECTVKELAPVVERLEESGLLAHDPFGFVGDSDRRDDFRSSLAKPRSTQLHSQWASSF